MSKKLLLQSNYHELAELFRTNDLKYSYAKLQEFGGIDGIQKTLNVKRIQDIRNNSIQYNYQGNEMPSLFKVIKSTLANAHQITLNLIIILLLILSFYNENHILRMQRYQIVNFSYYIMGFNLFAVIISVISNWKHSSQEWEDLNVENNWIVRTKNEHGNEVQKFQHQLREGDVLLIEPNKRVINVDGLLIQGDILVDESLLTGEYELQRKTIYNVNESQASPFFYSGSTVFQGYGELLVVILGNNTQYIKIKTKNKEDQNPMFSKLFKVYVSLSKMGMLIAIIYLLYNILKYMIIDRSMNFNSIFSNNAIQSYLQILLISLTIVIQAYPQSYTFFGPYSFAYIVNSFLKDLLLIRSLMSVEIFAYVNHIITDIKGVFTLDKLKITEIWYQEQNVVSFNRFQLVPDDIRQHYINCCLLNTSYDPYEEIIRGYDFEVALVHHCQVLGQHRSDYKPKERIIKQFKLYKQKKYKMTIVRINDEFVLYVTGDHNKVIPKCIQSKRFLKFDKLNYKYIALAYKVLNIQNINYVNEKDLFKQLNLIFIVGFQDQQIVALQNVIDEIKESNLRVTMITEDPVYYAKNFVESLSIMVDSKYSIISGKEFREQTEGVIRDGADFKVKNFENFVQIANSIKVLAEATPLDKFILTVGLKQMGDIICSIGRKDQDVPTARQSNLAICLESKSDEGIRLVSDIIAFSGQFRAIFNGFTWSKSLLQRMRKLTQHQIPIVITLIYTNVATTMYFGYEYSINPFQTFWIVTIMSIMQGIQFASEPAHFAIKKSLNPHINDPLINAYVLKVIFFQLLYQLFIINLLIFLPSQYFIYVDVNQEQRSTMIFTTLILLDIFSSIVSKAFDNLNTSVYKVMFDSKIFIIMLITQISSSYFMMFFAEHLLEIVQINKQQHLICLGLSFGIIVFCTIASIIPTKWFLIFHRQMHRDSIKPFIQIEQLELSQSLRFKI